MKRMTTWIGLALVMAFLMFLLSPATPSFANSFNVNDLGDLPDLNPGDGACAAALGPLKCTLRAAIEESNKNAASSNTINVGAGIITLTLGELVVTKKVTIVGAGQANTIVDGSNKSRIFNFATGSGPHSVSGLTVRNGNCGACKGHPAGAGWWGGGAIYNDGTLTLTNVTVTNSRGTQGAGIMNQYASGANIPTLTLNAVTITANEQTGTTFGQGGGGLFNGGRLAGTNVTIVNNTAATQGAGFYNNSYHNASLTTFTIANNTAKYGGGVNNDLSGNSASVTLTNGTISGNKSNCCGDNGTDNTGGGGVYNNVGTMTLTNVTLSNNEATSSQGYGGGIVNNEDMTLNGVTVNGNKASYGAGIYNLDTLRVTNSTLYGNTGTGSSSGAGLFNTGNGQASLNNVTIDGNSSSYAGGIDNSRNNNGGLVTLSNTILHGNTATLGSANGHNCQGAVQSAGYNLLGGSTGCTFSAGSGDQTNVASAGLAGLANNGGPTFTQMLLPGSPAIDTGSPASCATVDQRGIARPQGARCDIGAFEVRPGVDVPPKPSLFLPLILR